MKKFDFRLKTVLRVRKQEEEQKKRVVGALVTEINQHQQKALGMAEMIRQQDDVVRKQLANNQIDTKWIANYNGFVTGLQQAINREIKAVAEVQNKLYSARQELAHAAKETKVLEKLKEKQKLKHDQHLRKLEANENDEIGNSLFIRQQKDCRND